MALDLSAPPVGDFFGPYFSVRFFNLISHPTSAEDLAAQSVEGLTQRSRREQTLATELNFLGIAVATGGRITSTTGVSLTQAATDVSNIGRDTLIDQHLPRVAASMTAESKSGSPFRVQITLTPEYEDALVIMNSRLITYSTVAEVEWGYNTNGPDGEELKTRKYYIRIVYPKINFGENISIVLEGYDLSSDFAKRNSGRRSWTRAEVPNDFELVKKLIERNPPYKLRPSSLNDALANNFPVAESTIFSNPDDRGVHQVGSDWQFINRLLRKHNLSFYINGTDFNLYSLVNPSASEQNVIYTFRWRQAMQGPRDIPVYNSTCNILNSFFLPSSSRGLVNVSHDPITGEFKASTITPRDAPHSAPKEMMATAGGDSPELGSLFSGKAANTFAFTADGGAMTITPEPETSPDETGDVVTSPPLSNIDPNETDGRVLTLLKENGIFSAPRIKLRCPGVPRMVPNRIVRLRGFTDIFDGLYMVLHVKHMVSSSGYDMDVEVVRYSAVSATRQDDAPKSHQAGDSGGDTEPTADDLNSFFDRNTRGG